MSKLEGKVYNEVYVEAAKDLMSNFKKIGVEAIVAGGCPRDYLLNKQIKDIDIYIKYNKDTKNKVDLYLLELHEDGAIDNLRGSSTYAESVIGNIVKVIRGTFSGRSKYAKIDFILTDTELDLVDYVDNNFDLSICKAVFDGDKFYGLDDFNLTVYNKEVTFNSKLTNSLARHSITKHLNKIKRKFPEFKFNFLGNQKIGSIKKVLTRTKLSDKMITDYILKTDNSIFIGYDDFDNEFIFDF